MISIIVPVYKVRKYLEKCVYSILRNTYSDIQVVLIDDGCPEGCGKLCDNLATKDKRITVVHKTNGGQSSARNAGLKVANGEYLAFVDSDDWVEPTFLEKPLRCLEKSGADIVCFGLKKVYDDRVETDVVPIPQMVDSEQALSMLLMNKPGIHNYPCNKLFKRNLFDGLQFREGFVFEDIDIMYKLFSKASKIFLTNDILYNYLQREGNTTSTYDDIRSIRDRFYILHDRLAFIRIRYPQYENTALIEITDLVLNAFIVKRGEVDRTFRVDMYDFLEENVDKVRKENKSLFLRLYKWGGKPIFKLACFTVSLFRRNRL